MKLHGYAVIVLALLGVRAVGINVVGAGDHDEPSDPESRHRKRGGSSAPTSARDHGESLTEDCLKYINCFRTLHLPKPLRPLRRHEPLEKYMEAKMAQHGGENCSKLTLDLPPGIGATYYALKGGEPTCEKATRAWYLTIDQLRGEDTWKSILERHANWTGVDPADLKSTNTTDHGPEAPSASSLMESLKQVLAESK